VPELMRGCDLLCLSSRSEGFPNVVGEAMSTGVPVVTTDVGDARALVGDTGWVAPPRSPDALAEKLDSALSLAPDAVRDHGRRARWRIEQHYSISSISQEYITLYRRLSGLN
jgi:glycosyltransferase involved in cell wall biosynthesis